MKIGAKAIAIPGIPLGELLARPLVPGGTRVLLIGGDDVQAQALVRLGYSLDRHQLDMGPLAQLAGIPFTPPVVDWPFARGSFDAVILLDQLAQTVLEEEALAEAARVLRPSGVLLLRVPSQEFLGWLDGFNLYRYARDITGRGAKPAETAGVGWRRHYRRDDVLGLLRPHFRVVTMASAGLGLAEVARAVLMLFWRWALVSRRGERAIRNVPTTLMRVEATWSLAGHGTNLVVAAELAPSTFC
jgi:SAM-dependent methyltransferase